jgi:hypothetical protein
MDITFTLPDELIERARAEGLLTPQRMSQWLEDELRRADARRHFAEMTRKLRAVEPAITEAEIEAELAARKAERLAPEQSE